MKELPVFDIKETFSPRRRQHRFARKNSSHNGISPTTDSSNRVSRYKKYQHHDSYEQRHRKVITATFSMIFLVYLYTVFRTEALLEDYRLRGGNGGVQVEEDTSKDKNDDDDYDEKRRSTIHYGFDRFIVFKQMKFGQGHGNIMSGLLAAHLMGEEFNRIVCVEKNYVDFHAAFELKDARTRELCETLVDHEPNVPKEDFLQAISFADAPNECALQERLALDTKVIKFEGNTYPRWPKVPHRFFLKFYQPRVALLDILPYSKQPDTVVHLRAPDGASDAGSRQGLDNASFVELGRMLPSDTYLVTNQVDWYTFFHEQFNWSHPNWSIVRHSISGIVWKANNHIGKNETVMLKDAIAKDPSLLDNQMIQILQAANIQNITLEAVEALQSDSSVATEPREQGPMQMFADWYTVLMAKHVYHTHSEFSNSAAHWMNIEDSHVLNGINQTTLQLTFRPEAWIADGVSPAILDRTRNATLPLEMQLRACDTHHHVPITQNDNPMGGDNGGIPRPVAVTSVRVGGKTMKMDGEQIVKDQR